MDGAPPRIHFVTTRRIREFIRILGRRRIRPGRRFCRFPNGVTPAAHRHDRAGENVVPGSLPLIVSR